MTTTTPMAPTMRSEANSGPSRSGRERTMQFKAPPPASRSQAPGDPAPERIDGGSLLTRTFLRSASMELWRPCRKVSRLPTMPRQGLRLASRRNLPNSRTTAMRLRPSVPSECRSDCRWLHPEVEP